MKEFYYVTSQVIVIWTNYQKSARANEAVVGRNLGLFAIFKCTGTVFENAFSKEYYNKATVK